MILAYEILNRTLGQRYLEQGTKSIKHKRKKIDVLDLIKIKNLFSPKDNIKKVKTQGQTGMRCLEYNT